MVVRQPGEWFAETLRCIAQQDYPNLRHVFFVADTDEDFEQTAQTVLNVLPNAFVRQSTTPDSFGATINEVLRLVTGNNGLFLVCHDDVAPEPNAVTVLVNELFRSKAGIVGPKLVEWDSPQILQHVGLGLDRFGEVDRLIEQDEVDQEQHDAIRDVFVIPSAFMLVRADLFRVLGGFDPDISLYGEDIELCWRAHYAGARVVIVPDAKVRHREQMEVRRPDINRMALQARHRMRTVATLTSGPRLIIRSLQIVGLTVAELVVGLFTGRLGEAIQSLWALIGLIPRTPKLLARRRVVNAERKVPEREVLSLQVRGSSRLVSFLRGRETATYVGDGATVRRWRQAGYGPVLSWSVFLALLVIGSRRFIQDAVPPVGEFLSFESASAMVGRFRTSFDGRGLGATRAVPTGWLFMSIASIMTFFKMSLFKPFAVLGLVFVAALGAWRVGSIFPFNRGRIAVMAVYVGAPLVPLMLGTGSFSALVWFAGLPWLVNELRRAAALEPADPDAAGRDLRDGVASVSLEHRIRAIAVGSIVLALVVGFAPAAAPLWLFVGLLMALATFAAGGRKDVTIWMLIAAVATTLGGLILNVPWTFAITWAHIVGADGGATGRSVTSILSMSSESVNFPILALGLYAPVVVGVAVNRAWRLTWSVRALFLVVWFGGLLVLKEFGIIAGWLPSAGMLVVPMLLGVAIAAGSFASGLESDVLAQGFGWRQPVAVLANAAMVVGLMPVLLGIGSGDWGADSLPTASLVSSQFPADPEVGDYRVLYVGQPDLLPVPGRDLMPGVAYAIADSGDLTFPESILTAPTSADAHVSDALRQIASGSTLRGGRALAPLGIRYIAVPTSRGIDSAEPELSSLNESLISALSNQLDIGRIEAAPTIEAFQNQSFIPVGADLAGGTAAASEKAGLAALVRSDFDNATPVLVGADGTPPVVSGPVNPSVITLAIPYDERIGLEVGGSAVPSRPAFGLTTGFDMGSSGDASVTYDPSGWRTLWLFVLLLGWVAAVLLAFSPRMSIRSRLRGAVVDETLIDLAGEATLEDLDEYGRVISAEPLATTASAQVSPDDPADGPIDPGLTGAIPVVDATNEVGVDETTVSEVFADDDWDDEWGNERGDR